ncbi:hypothetical protein [Streptomyces sp. NPDC018693]|uniref:hypothetical protein n=1 Tax=unclassified Streptomyces TaxID=2593676 RepID=UPI00379C954A
MSTVVIAKVWETCDTGVNASANSLTLLFLVPVIWPAAALHWLVVHGALGGRWPAVALAAGVGSVCGSRGSW